jgi:hypothetical protein
MNANEEFEKCVYAVARGHYLNLSSDPSYALPPPTQQGAEIFADFILKRAKAPGILARADEATRDCDVQSVQDKSALQERLAEALRDFRLRTFLHPHPWNDTKARAFAEVIVAEIGQPVEQQAFDTVKRRQHMSELELREEEAREHEAAIERDRQRRRPLKPLYPI